MQLLLSLDYELFFGPRTGTVDRCLLQPTEALAETARRHGVQLSFFVDALYLHRLAEEARRFPRLQADFDAVCRQLTALDQQGHDLQLHLHPHWLDSSFDGEHWRLDTTRYKLHDFPSAEVAAMVGCAKKVLTDLVGDKIFAYRAGGWCLQPFAPIAQALLAHDIWLDSTVFAGGVSTDKDRWFDFSTAPVKDHWPFNDDPNSEDSNGPFVEVPISGVRVGPLLFWRMILTRKILRQVVHKQFGDGSSLSWGSSYYLQRLFRSSISVVSLDGLKAGLLGRALRQEQAKGKHVLHAMGHPKALSRYSIDQLDKFLSAQDYTTITFRSLRHLKAPCPSTKKTEKGIYCMNPKISIKEEAARFPTVQLFNIPLKAMTMSQALDLVDRAIAASAPLQIGVVNAAKVVNMYRNPALCEDVLSSDVIFADGASVVWASHILGHPLPERVPGIDLMMGMLQRGQKHRYRVYLFGATEEINRTVAERIAADYPGVIVAGRRNGYFTADEEQAIADDIAIARPDILLVAITSPKKEQFLARWSDRIRVPICHGVGGSFDVYAGKVKRAPLSWQRCGMEWLYRLLQEPRRMWKRYLVTNFLFCWLVAREGLRTKR